VRRKTKSGEAAPYLLLNASDSVFVFRGEEGKGASKADTDHDRSKVASPTLEGVL
jgi:hypothetical protein